MGAAKSTTKTTHPPMKPNETTKDGMQVLAGPYQIKNPVEMEMCMRVVRDMERPDRRGNRIKWRSLETQNGTEIWRVPDPETILPRSAEYQRYARKVAKSRA